uniref:tRNA pseudouridine synthase n=1 Tax=Photinus pyralis TaxID=7054 RepID=A0A1Y1MIY9_PHOPY
MFIFYCPRRLNEVEMEKIGRKKIHGHLDITQLSTFSKEDLIDKIIALQCHNVELKNIIAKSQQRNQKRSYPPQKPFDFTRCKFRHVLLQVLYLGWDYQGYACQEDSLNTIEHFLFEALLKTCLIKDRQSSNYHRCGRTDKGVSAFGQVRIRQSFGIIKFSLGNFVRFTKQ